MLYRNCCIASLFIPTFKIKRAIESILRPFCIEDITKLIKKALRAIYESTLFLDTFSRFIE